MVLFLELAEDHTERLATWFDTSSNNVAVTPLEHEQIDLASSHAWSHMPNVLESDTSEGTTPARCDGNST